MKPNLTLTPEFYGICRLAPNAGIPDWACRGSFYSITRTPEEVSVVCPEEDIPPAVPCVKGWRMLRVEGPLDFSLTGVLSALTQPLALAGIPVFTLSTYDTDYLLVGNDNITEAVRALADAGFGMISDGMERSGFKE